MNNRETTWADYKKSVIEDGKKLEAGWNDFFCGKGGCPYFKKKCDPDNCGQYHHYKNGDFWNIYDGIIVFFKPEDIDD
jgi:hypothetical protein